MEGTKGFLKLLCFLYYLGSRQRHSIYSRFEISFSQASHCTDRTINSPVTTGVRRATGSRRSAFSVLRWRRARKDLVTGLPHLLFGDWKFHWGSCLDIDLRLWLSWKVKEPEVYTSPKLLLWQYGRASNMLWSAHNYNKTYLLIFICFFIVLHNYLKRWNTGSRAMIYINRACYIINRIFHLRFTVGKALL